MAEYPLIFMRGRMTDEKFLDPKVCLVTGINATSFKPSGIAKDLSETYKYASLFDSRKQLYNINRTIWSDRPRVGSVVVKEPPESSNYPTVVGLVTQFGQGDALEENAVSKYCVENSRDAHYVNGLKMDTTKNRRENFKQCLKELCDYIINISTIGKVVFPAGIGARGKLGQEWVNYICQH